MDNPVVIAVFLLPAACFIALLILVFISDILQHGVDYCTTAHCGPAYHLLLHFIATLLQIITIPIFLMLFITEMILHFILTVLYIVSWGLIVVLGHPGGIALAVVLLIVSLNMENMK